MRNSKFSLISIFLCLLSMLWLLSIERSIYLDYSASNGKTKALFGLKELFSYGHKHYLIVNGLVGLVLTGIGFKKNESQLYLKASLVLSIATIILSIFGIWRFFI